jgi:hypothetical protein
MAYQGYTAGEIGREIRRTPNAVRERASALNVRLRAGRADSPETADWLRHQVGLLSRRAASARDDAFTIKSRSSANLLRERVQEVLERLEHLKDFVARSRKRLGHALVPLQTRLVTIGRHLKTTEERLAQKSGRGWKVSLKTVKKVIKVVLYLLDIVVGVSNFLGSPIAPAAIRWIFEMTGVMIPAKRK